MAGDRMIAVAPQPRIVAASLFAVFMPAFSGA
jgi:hypothetical protein